jgi:dihydroorotate dehydrogenase
MSKPPAELELEPLIVSAPFGNYIQPTGTTPTLGTFTAARRGGRSAAFGRTILTVRYYRRLNAWVNRIGLRNPGIDSLKNQPAIGLPLEKSIVSIHGFDAQDWSLLLNRIERLRPLAVELNISCPNVGELSWPPGLFGQAIATGVPVIVKLPPIRFHQLASDAAAAGVQWFHATNTLPVAGGGMSGAPLKPIALQAVSWLRAEFGQATRIIGGGGIRSAADINDFAQAGADRFAVGSLAMRPSAPFSEKWIAGVRAAAQTASR